MTSKVSGIYKITNNIDGKVYIGKTKNFKNRWRQYLYDFENKRVRCLNSYIMNAMLKYGFDSFTFSIVESCDVSICAERELYWMDFYDSCNHDKGYNLRRDSSSGMITHESTSNKISKRLKEEWSSGIRSDHSDKMIKKWSEKDKAEQSAVMTKVLTKYNYKLTSLDGSVQIVAYKQLCELGLKNVIPKFHKQKSDVVKCKGYIVERFKINESKA